MLKKTMLLLMLCFSANLFCMDSDLVEEVIGNENVQSIVAGAVSAYVRPIIVDYFKKQPVRAGALTSMIFLAHGLNIFRHADGKMKRFLATLFGAAATAFIRNK